MEMTEQINEIAGALAMAQAEIESATKDRINPHFKQGYATLASVWDACRKPLSKNNLSVVQFPKAEGKSVTLTTMLLHKSGQWFREILVMEAMNGTPQAVGSAITYARRYALASMVGVAPDDDDDGNAGSGRKSDMDPQQKAQPATMTPPPPTVDEMDERRKAWKAIRAKVNKTLLECKTLHAFQEIKSGFEKKYSAEIWANYTFLNETETYASLFEQHEQRIKRDEELSSPAGIIRWIEAVTVSDMRGLAQRISEYRNQARLQNPQCEQALDDRAIALGFPAFVELERQDEEGLVPGDPVVEKA